MSNLDYLQKQFKEQHAAVLVQAAALAGKTRMRRRLAYMLKAISIFGAIAITAGVGGQIAQLIGIAIACAVGVDALSSNHSSLLALAEAQHAFDALAKKAERTHTLRLATALATSDERAKAEQLSGLLGELLQLLISRQEEIEERLRKRDLEALRHLALDDKPPAAGRQP